jgi:hypothetical protein
MRISDSLKRAMKAEILEDLYKKPEDELNKRQADICKRNRIYELEPYQDILNALPVELVAHARQYKLDITYKRDSETNKFAIDETWSHYYETDVFAFVSLGQSNYGSISSINGTLDSRLYNETAILAEELLELRKTKKELDKYLTDTLEKWSGPKQLRTVWPESLHKYLPVIKARTPKVAKDKPPVPMAAEAPTSLGTRLTANLLEGE